MDTLISMSVGGTWHAPHLAYQLQRFGLLQTVITTTPKARFRNRAEIDPRSIEWFPIPDLFGARPPTMLKISPKIYSGSPYLQAIIFDLYVAKRLRALNTGLHIAFSRFGLSTFKTAKRLNIPTVVERGSSHTQYRLRLLAEEYDRLNMMREFRPLPPELIERELEEYEIATYIAVPSHFAARSFIEYGVAAEKIICIPYGVDLARFVPKPTRNAQSFRVMSVGNMGVEKGTGYLIDAIEQLKGIPIELVLVGSLDVYITERLKQTSIKWAFAGHLNQNQLPEWYNTASVYCLPSIQEGLSMTGLEAMACGLPVIVSEHTGVNDLLTEGVDGFVVPIRNTEAIAERLLQLYDDESLRVQVGENARQRVMRFSWDEYGNSFHKVYHPLLPT